MDRKKLDEGLRIMRIIHEAEYEIKRIKESNFLVYMHRDWAKDSNGIKKITILDGVKYLHSTKCDYHTDLVLRPKVIEQIVIIREALRRFRRL